MKALITGAGGGIGREMAALLARRGYDLILTGRDEKKLRLLQKHLPVSVEIITADLSKEEECFRLYEQVKGEEIEVLINNAGFGVLGCFWDIPLETELNMLDLNVRAVHILTKLFLADFRKRNRGYILNVASSAGFSAGPLMSTYYATKNYVLRLTEAIHEELRQEGSGVHISALCPGPVDTPFHQRAGGKVGPGAISAGKAARKGLQGLFRGQAIILPGWTMQLIHAGQKLLSEKMLLKAAYHIQKGKMG